MWRYRDMVGSTQAPGCLGIFEGQNLIVMAGARCVWDDYLALEASGFKGDIMCVNRIGMYIEKPFKHWLSLHADLLTTWKELLTHQGVETSGIMTHTFGTGTPHIGWRIGDHAAYSGLFAAQVGVCLGYEEIVLCGVPMDNSGHFYDPPWTSWKHDDKHAKFAFEQTVGQHRELKTRVRSMSGWTKELFERMKKGLNDGI